MRHTNRPRIDDAVAQVELPRCASIVKHTGVVTTLDEWVTELNELHANLGSTKRMLMRWFPRYDTPRGPPLWYAYERLRGRPRTRLAWEVALYVASAEPGTRPVAVVDVAADSTVPAEQPTTVEVAGRVEAGGAVALVMPGGDVVFAIGPVSQNVLMGRRRL
jgi:hypothetical protein